MREVTHRFRRPFAFAALSAGIALGAIGVAQALQESGDRRAAFWGIACAWLTGTVSLFLKRWATAKSLRAVLGTMGALFGVRMLFLIGAIVLLVSRQSGTGWSRGPVLAFTVGFFGVYFILQWIEIAYVSQSTPERGITHA